MNDGFDPLFAARSYDCEKSRAGRDKWLKHREDSGLPVVQHLDRFAEVPSLFARQYAAMRDRKREAPMPLLQAGKGE